MKTNIFRLLAALLLLASLCATAQSAPKNKRKTAAPPANGPAAMAATADQAHLDAILSKWKRVEMPFHADGLSPRERQMVSKLVEATHYLEDIYWRQSDPEGLALLKSIEEKTDPKSVALRRCLMIYGNRFDLLDDDKPFVGSQPMPPGRGFYPEGLTREQIEQFVKAHPDKKDQIYGGQTIVQRQGDNNLVGVPYHVAFKAFLEPAARDLRQAADLSDDKAFADFLRARADALLSDDYYASDLKWLDLENPKFDIIFAPYETYLDGLLGVKTSYGVAVMVRNEEESSKLAVFQKYVPDIQDSLPLAPEDRPSKRGHQSPMEVMDTPFRGGDLRHGYQAVADNLPNDPRIHEQKGSKKIFFKNFMDARVNYVILPLAKIMMDPEQAQKASADGYLAATMMHEISHGLGPAFARVGGKQVDIREAIGPAFGGLEEAKADVVGMVGLNWLMDHGAMPKERAQEFYASYLAGIFRTTRFGVAEAHGRAEMMEFNYLTEQKAITRDPATGKYAVDYTKIPAALESLAKELLEQEATGDRNRTEQWFARYSSMPSELQSALKAAGDLPVDIDPVFSFPEPIR